MRLLLAAALALAAGLPAAAQTTPAAPQVYDPAPWWMDKPIVASTGHVWTEVLANRGRTSATFEAVDSDAAQATRQATDKVRAVAQALAAYGADKARVETSFRINPLYAQYRDRQGEVNENQRADKIERYQVVAEVQVEIRDVRLAERIYATLMSARPSSTQPVTFRLVPDNETLTQMARLAVEDARRRAVLSSEAAGARLGTVRLIDPTARACEADVLVAGAGRSYGGPSVAQRVPAPPPPPPPAAPSLEDIVVTAGRQAQAVGLDPAAVQMPLHPPLQRLESRACVVFSLG
jgi:uncharacterized protein YggE